MVSKKIKIKNPTGLHLHPAGVLCNVASEFDSHIEILFKDNVVNAKSVLSILGACIKLGDEVVITCEGSDEIAALEKLCEILDKDILE